MGKRKFKKPDDSDSEYEWEEAKPKKTTTPPTKSSPKESDLNDFLNQYSTKSLGQIRLDKQQEERDKQTKLFEDRLYKPTEASSIKFDHQWLKKSFHRCKEQAEREGENLVTVLRDRYDSETVEFMMREFGRGGRAAEGGSFRKRNDRDSGDYGRKEHREERGAQRERQGKEEKIETKQIIEERFVTEEDINAASASLMRAELSGNQSKIAKLEKKLKTLREAQRRKLKIRLTIDRKEKVNSPNESDEEPPRQTRRHSPDKSKRSIDTNNWNSLIKQERSINAFDNDLQFARMCGRSRGVDSKSIDDVADREYNDKSGFDVEQNKASHKSKHKSVKTPINRSTFNNKCRLCSDRLEKHLVVCKTSHFRLIVPVDLGITDFHCQLVPIDHVSAFNQIVDSEVWDDLSRLKQTVVTFFTEQHQSETVFMETAIGLDKYPHAYIDCVPLKRSKNSLSNVVSPSVFFRKSIDEAKSEWCQNRRSIDLVEGDIRRTVPKRFPYFCVEFGIDGGGYALVIEKEEKFSDNFGREIVGSLLGKDLIQINNRKARSFNEQADAVLRFEKKWRPYDLWKNEIDDDDSD